MFRRRWPLFILLMAFALRMVNLTGESLWRDEVDSVRFAFEPLGGILRNFTANGFNGPLYHLLLRGWLSLAGVSDFALRYFSVVCGVALVGLVYVLSKRLFGRRAALAAMWLSALSPVLIWYAGEGKMYALQPMLLTLALYALVRACSRRLEISDSTQSSISNSQSRLWWSVFVAATSLSFYTHLLSPIFLVVAVIFFLAMWPRSKAHLKGGIIALALLTLPYLPLAVWQLPALIRGGDVGHTFYPLDVVARTLLSYWTVGMDGRAPLLDAPVSDATLGLARWLVPALFIALALYGLIDSRTEDVSDRPPPAVKWAVLAWLVLPTLIVFAISLRFPIFQPRYMLWSAPALYVLAGVGLAHVGQEGVAGRWAWRTALGVLTLLSVSGFVAQVIHPIRPDLRGAAALIAREIRPGDKVVFQIPYGRYSFEYYAERNGVASDAAQIIEAPFTNYGMSEDEVSATLFDVLGDAQRLWLFETEASMWDARGLVRAWADADLRMIERREFRGASVGLYELP